MRLPFDPSITEFLAQYFAGVNLQVPGAPAQNKRTARVI